MRRISTRPGPVAATASPHASPWRPYGVVALAAMMMLPVACTSAGSALTATTGPHIGPTVETPTTAASTNPDRSVVSTQGSSACPLATITVTTSLELADALRSAHAGDHIALADGRFVGHFVATTRATEQQPITLCGGPAAVLDGGGIAAGYVLHLDGVSDWRLTGFTVRNGQKGVMVDHSTRVHITGLTVEDIGDEAIHLRADTTDTTVKHNTIRRTGQRKPQFGEGIYVGTARSNWTKITRGQPDHSDRNQLIANTITDTTAESIDIKEGTTGGLISANTFNGTGLTKADSWVDVKGNNWLIEDNAGHNSPLDGFQTHQIIDGAGAGNTFRRNTAYLNGSGYAFHFAPPNDNVLTCDNRVIGTAQLSKNPCTNH